MSACEKVKTCTACGEDKPLSSFETRVKGGYRYLLGPCRDCERDRKNTRNRKLNEERLFNTYRHDALKSPCIKCPERSTCKSECLRFRMYVKFERFDTMKAVNGN